MKSTSYNWRRVGRVWNYRQALTLTAVWLGTLTGFTAPLTKLPGSDLNLRLTAPIKTGDEAVPLGNGTMGILFWGV